MRISDFDAVSQYSSKFSFQVFVCNKNSRFVLSNKNPRCLVKRPSIIPFCCSASFLECRFSNSEVASVRCKHKWKKLEYMATAKKEKWDSNRWGRFQIFKCSNYFKEAKLRPLSILLFIIFIIYHRFMF